MLSRIRRFLCGGREHEVSRPPVPSDIVYPVHPLDYSYKGSTITWLMRFSDVLDGDKLHSSLTRLLETGDWKKLGGRLRSDKAGRLTLHVPQTFTPARPAVAYSKETFDVDIEQHELGNQMPKPTDVPSLQNSMNHLTGFWGHSKTPMKAEDYLNSDKPQLSLHVVTFRNATIVALSCPHSLTDIMGSVPLMKAWSHVLAGRLSDVPPLLGAWEDASRPVWDTDKEEPFRLQSNLLRGLGLFKFVVRFIFGILRAPRTDARTLFLPAAFVTDLRDRALGDLEKGTFVSDGDILGAWLARLVAAANGKPDSLQPVPIALGNTCDIRARLPEVFEKDGAYVQNLVTVAVGRLDRTSVYPTAPLGAVAAHLRQSLVEQTTESEVRGMFRAVVQSNLDKKKKTLAVFADADSTLMGISNWTKAKYTEIIDFSPAVVRFGERSALAQEGGGQLQPPPRNNPPGKMEYLIGGSLHVSPVARNFFIIHGKDFGDNYWVTMYMPRNSFGVIEEYVRGEARIRVKEVQSAPDVIS
ncbi:hypothetical protein BX600DRAFT_513488 [Xylariales sp. PMI_506]|nr:hypothetical protein BX600DRAFT_513488 [Xylariales sp. PMI_506]